MRSTLIPLILGGCGLVDRDPASLPQAESGVVLNELLAASAVGEDWIELHNPGDGALPLAGHALTDGETIWPFPEGLYLPANAWLLVPCDGTGENGNTTFKLSSDGETVSLYDPDGALLDQTTFTAQVDDVSWGRLPDGVGDWRGLAQPSPGAANAGGADTGDTSDPDDTGDTGTPPECADDPVTAQASLALNELFSNGSVQADWIEVHNRGDACFDLEGYRLTDATDLSSTWPFPADATVAPGAFLLIWCDEGVSIPGELHTDFKLSSGGEDIALIAPDDGGEPAVIDAVTLPALDEDSSWARLPDGTGEFQVSGQPTPGASNGG